MHDAPKAQSGPRHDATIDITTYAEKHGFTQLLQHIKSADATYRNLGLTPDSFQYSEKEQALTLQLTPRVTEQGHEGITHGGIIAFTIDAASGAIAMLHIDQTKCALTREHSIKYSGVAMTNVPILATSRIHARTDTLLSVTTEITQQGTVIATAETFLSEISPAIIERVKRNAAKRNGGVEQ